MKKSSTSSTIVVNKKAYFDYEVLETLEAGVVLKGYEIKAIRQGKINLKGSYVTVSNNEVWTENIHIGAYQPKNQPDYDPKRKRKLLLKRKEIDRLTGILDTKGVTAIPLKIYLSRNFAKMTLGICRGKKKYDKRDALKKKAVDLEVKRALKNY